MDFNNHKRKPPIYPISQAPPPNWNEFLPPPPQHPPNDSMRKTSQVIVVHSPFVHGTLIRIICLMFNVYFTFRLYSQTVAVHKRVVVCTPEVSRSRLTSSLVSRWPVAVTATHLRGFTRVRTTNTDSIHRLPLNRHR